MICLIFPPSRRVRQGSQPATPAKQAEPLPSATQSIPAASPNRDSTRLDSTVIPSPINPSWPCLVNSPSGLAWPVTIATQPTVASASDLFPSLLANAFPLSPPPNCHKTKALEISSHHWLTHTYHPSPTGARQFADCRHFLSPFCFFLTLFPISLCHNYPQLFFRHSLPSSSSGYEARQPHPQEAHTAFFGGTAVTSTC